MAEDDRIFPTIGYDRPRGTSYAAAWLKIRRRAGRDKAFARQVRAAIEKFIRKSA